MNKEDMKAMFEKEMQEAEQYITKNISDLPSKAGRYTIGIEGVMTMIPMYANFDGEKWTDMKSNLSMAFGDESKIYYYDKAPESNKKIKP